MAALVFIIGFTDQRIEHKPRAKFIHLLWLIQLGKIVHHHYMEGKTAFEITMITFITSPPVSQSVSTIERYVHGLNSLKS